MKGHLDRTIRPPRVARWILSRFMMPYNGSPALGDLKEEFDIVVEESGLKCARWWYMRQVMKSIPSFLNHIIYWRFALLVNYIRIALRNLKKQKIYSAITLSGLMFGLAAFILFALISESISSFDTFHENANRIYGVVQVFPAGLEGEQHSAITPAPLIPTLLNEFPEIEDATRFFPPGRMIVKQQDKIFYESGVKFVDPHFLSIFSFQMIMGNTETALSEPYSIVLTEASALKYFGDENPIGKSVTLNNKIDVVVTGITENVPRNSSSIYYDFLVSMQTADILYAGMDDWNVKNQASILLLSEGIAHAQLEAKLPAFINKHYPDSPDSPKRLYLHPLLHFFLKSNEIDGYWAHGQISSAVLWIVAVLLLIVACINFMNLSTARFVIRANEVGVRKVIGAQRPQLIKQFLGESILISLISLPAAILLYEIARPALRAYLGDIFGNSLWDYPQLLILIIGVTILTGIFAGSYPAFYLSAFRPVQVLKGGRQSGKKGGRLRKILVVFQFTISIILIVITIVSIRQSDHNLKVDLGYSRNRVLVLEIGDEAPDKLEVMKNELAQHEDIISVSASTAIPIDWDTKRQVYPEGGREDDALNMNVYGVDYNFIETLGIKMMQGRSFSPSRHDSRNFIVNETAVQQLQWENPIGEQLTIINKEKIESVKPQGTILSGGPAGVYEPGASLPGDQKGTVIGVAKDFHFKSILFTGISPAVLYLEPDELNYILVKYSSTDRISGILEHIREQWKILAPDVPLEYVTLDNVFQEVYVDNDKTAELTGAIGIMAILMSCMGLFGLSSFAVEKKIKEIGIRKVLGASVTGIVRMLIKEFMKLVVIANVLALPIAYFLNNRINQFFYAYPIRIGADIFIFTIAITVLVAFFTVVSQALRAARANPVESLKYE